MNRTETLADIAARYPAIPASVAETHWRKSDAYLRMLNRKYAAHTDGGTLTQFVKDVAADVADASRCRPRRTAERRAGMTALGRVPGRENEKTTVGNGGMKSFGMKESADYRVYVRGSKCAGCPKWGACAVKCKIDKSDFEAAKAGMAEADEAAKAGKDAK